MLEKIQSDVRHGLHILQEHFAVRLLYVIFFTLIFRAITSIFYSHLCCIFNDSVTLEENLLLNVIKVLNLHFYTGAIIVKFDQQFECHFSLY